MESLAVDVAGNLYGVCRFDSSSLQLDECTLSANLVADLLFIKTDSTLPPALNHTRVKDSMHLTWNALFYGYQLESCDPGSSPATWSVYPATVNTLGLTNSVQIPLQDAGRLFRLAKS